MATSGDTGGAVLDGFGKLPGNCLLIKYFFFLILGIIMCLYSDESGVQVLVLYPDKGISDIQKAQMTSCPHTNVSVIGNQCFTYIYIFN